MAGAGAPYRRRGLRRASVGLSATAVALLSAAVLSPIVAASSPSPRPSPTLDQLLAHPPSADFAADTESTGTPIGEFDLMTYVESLAPPDASAAERVLHDDGFVAGYGKSWTSQSSNVGLVELVVAFAGGRGARNWLGSAEADAKSSQFFKASIVVEGIDPYYGARYADPSSPSFADVVSFVKGNDYFLVGFVSDADNLGDAAAAQSKRQFDFAAAASIREADWPENARPGLFGLPAGRLALTVLAGGLALSGVVGVAIAVVVLVMLRRGARPPAAPS